MMDSFSKALELTGANSTTSFVLWLMIIFLLILIAVICIALIKQLKQGSKNNTLESSCINLCINKKL